MAKNDKTYYPISQEQIAKDASLESLLFDIQHSLGDLSQILQDYIYMNSGSSVYPVHKKRTQDEFYTDFNNVVDSVISKLEGILKLFPKKKIDDYTILMKLLDENAPNDSSWFHYHLILIKSVMENFIERINCLRPTIENNKNFCILKRIWKYFIKWITRKNTQRSAKDCYENFYILEGNASFLYDMCHDVSFLLCNLYSYNVWKYRNYIRNSQVNASKNPFTRYDNMQKMGKSHKAHSRTLLDSCEALINKTFFKDDINAVPIMTSLLRMMIEIRFEEYLGIQTIYIDENHSKVKKVVGSDYFELAELDKYAVLPIPLDAIKRIYSWASEFVHKGVSDYYWIIFFVREYLMNFILCNVYMDEDYYDNLRNKIVTLFNTTEKCVEWKEPINLRKVSHDRLDDIRTEIKNKGYEEFRKLENKREFEALEKLQEKMRMKKSCSNL